MFTQQTRWQMPLQQWVRAAVCAALFAGFATMHLTSGTLHADADDHPDSDARLSAVGLRIAPDFIQIGNQDPLLVGLESFIVNAQADCNGCHGSDPANGYLPTNNPYFLPPNNLGPAGPGIVKNPKSALFGGPGLGPKNIISRNLTPDYTSNPEGGHDLGSFITILRTGHDFDKLHPNVAAQSQTIATVHT